MSDVCIIFLSMPEHMLQGQLTDIRQPSEVLSKKMRAAIKSHNQKHCFKMNLVN